ncbi:MAG: hypothetical protein IPG53_09115 [Ignavibacteriales bacterium]|nr:hypothetical protein [Ignavibacteriales bacterium]
MTAQQLLIPESVMGWIQIAEDFATPVAVDGKTETVETKLRKLQKLTQKPSSQDTQLRIRS